MKISKMGLEIFFKNLEIYETCKSEHFIAHLYCCDHSITAVKESKWYPVTGSNWLSSLK